MSTTKGKKQHFLCNKCNLTFKNNIELANHLNMFCVDSVYANPHKLLQQLNIEYNQDNNAHLTFNEIKNYLKNGGLKLLIYIKLILYMQYIHIYIYSYIGLVI